MTSLHSSNRKLTQHIRIALRRPSLSARLPLRLHHALMVGLSATLLSTPPVNAVELPQICTACSVGNNKTVSWATPGTATATVSGDTLTIKQSVENVTLNWASFNISADGKVIFSQPSTSSIALNRIFQQSPSQILGSIKTQLNSDASKPGGQIYLINPNGFLFGAGSSVNAAGILVSTLSMSDDVFNNGLLSAKQAALSLDTTALIKDEDGNPIKGNIVIQQGAKLSANKVGGRVMFASSNITNAGEVHADDGQIILAAGDKVYVAAANQNGDPLRGLYVEVGGEGTALNDITGLLSAERGDVSVVGLAINQQGRISATTSVSANGSVHLLARKMDDDAPLRGDYKGTPIWVPATAGTIKLGSQSNIDIGVAAEDIETTAVDAQLQDKSNIQIAAKQIIMQGGAKITAHGGNLTMHASTNPNAALEGITQIDDEARLRIDSGAIIDLSGNNATRSVADNIVDVELRGSELADSPNQRNGALRGQTVTVDARVGTAIADVSGAIGSIGKTVAQRTSEGGKASFVSTGDIVAAKDATIDVSGGQTTFTGAMVSTSQLITADGKIVDIANAKEDVTYARVVSPTTSIKHDRWGVIESVGQQTASHYEAGYTQGSSAGQVTFDAPTMIVNATLTGYAINGAYQRDPSATTYASGGLLKIGENNVAKDNNYRAPSVILTGSSPNISVSDDFSISGIPLTLSTDYLRNGGFTQTEINSNETITVAQDANLNLLPGSSFTIRATQVNINSGIDASAGTISINSLPTNTHATEGGINVADNVQFNVNGKWINDTELSNTQRPVTTLFQNAGSISLNVASIDSQLRIGNNVGFFADGGAWLKSSGAIVGGKGGSIALLSNGQGSSFYLGDGVGLSGYGVNGANGGAISLAAGRIQITDRNTWADAQVYDPSLPDSLWYFTIAPKLFRDYGFSTFNIAASGGTVASLGDALQIAADTTINALSDTLIVSTQAADHRSGDDVHLFSTATTLPDYQRNTPSKISLSVSAAAVPGQSSGALSIQRGSVISGDPGSMINLLSENGSIDIEGTLQARAGSISAHIKISGDAQMPYDPQLGIVVGEQAVLDASGSFTAKPNDSGLLQGVLRDGGNISLVADSGTVTLKNNSVLNVSGTSAVMDLPTATSTTPYLRQKVGSNAGTISLSAAESVFIAGDLQAKAGQGDTGIANGGSLSLAMTINRPSRLTDIDNTYPSSPRIVQLANTTATTTQNGIAAISTAQINAAGFDNLFLTAADAIKIDAGVNLSLHQRLQFDAPALQIGDGQINLAAGYLSIGNSALGHTSASAASGLGILNISADNIDLIGSVALQGFDKLNVISGGDIRFEGVSINGVQQGELFAAGDISLQAARTYATTATQFNINNNGYDVTFEQGSESPGTPLSAASKLIVNADSVHQNGTLLAPFGEIEINATDIWLGAGSITSVSGKDVLIPYGNTDSNGKTWLYNNASVQSLPGRSILLNGGDDVTIANNATIDLSGGGDLYAYEWIKGTGGTNDAFDFKLDPVSGNSTSVLTNPGLFAIIPSLGTQLAPVDVANQAVTRAQGLKAGDTVYLSGTDSLAAGFYTLLPANYSLLPGSYLVTAVSGFNNLQPSMNAALADGTPVVAGYRSFGSSGIGGTSYSGFAVYTGEWGRTLAQYRDSFASEFFDASEHRTVDAGQLSLVTRNTLAANGNILSTAATGGRAASIDVSASNLQIVGTLGQGSSGVVQLQDSVLNNWHAGSLLLGGVRDSSEDESGEAINVAASEVTVASDAHLTANEVIMVAADKVSIESGGSVQSTSNLARALTKPVTVNLKGDGADHAALVAVSTIAPMQVMRDNADASSTQGGQIDLAQDSIITTDGALIIDAPNGGVLQSSIKGANADWTIASTHLVFGDVLDAGQLNINASTLGDMQSAKSITLSSSGAIDFDHYSSSSGIMLGNKATSLGSITLHAASLNNLSVQDVALFATDIYLDGAAAVTLSPSSIAGNGTFAATADSINVTGQTMTLNRFANAQLQATQQFQVKDNGTLVLDGDINVTAARITASAASNGSLIATGNVQLDSAASTTLPTLELGGGLTIKGNNITDNANIVMPSGVVRLDASGWVTIGSKATIDVSGVPVYAAGVRADSKGGVIHLDAGDNLSALTGSLLNVDGSGSADAGVIDIETRGALNLQSMLSADSARGRGGSITVDANAVSNFSQLNDTIQQAHFTQQQSIHLAHGNMQLAADKQVDAHDVQWITDNGAIQVDGVINAASTDARSSIRLYGADGISVNGQLHADGDLTTGRGGAIELGVSTDTVNHADASINIAGGEIIAAGSEQGRLRLRAPIVNGNDLNISLLPTDVSRLDQIIVEAVSTLAAPSDVDWNNVHDLASSTFDALTSNITLQSKLSASNKVLLSPGVELTNSGDINLGAVDLYQWNFNGHNSPVAITVRAGGNINVNGIISDGFTSVGSGTRRYLSATDTPSATLRLTAGSDLGSVDPLAVIHANAADVVLNSNAVVRTGTGDLALAASHDVIINSGASVYTGGNNAPGQNQIVINNTGASASFLNSGGNLSITAGNDVTGAAVTQSVTAWQPRTASSNNAGFNAATIYWGEDLRQFQWNVGTLGGGDITINSGNDISTLSVAAADTGVTIGSLADGFTGINHYGGGAIELHAGNNINSGMLYAGRRSTTVMADNKISSAIWNGSVSPVGLFVSMGDSQVDIGARSGLTVGSVINSTMLDFSITGSRKAYFYTYGSSATLTLTTSAGDIIAQQNDNSFQPFVGANGNGSDIIKRVLPPNVYISALSGDVDVNNRLILFPSDTGNFSLFAGGDIAELNLTMSDASDSSIPLPYNPSPSVTAGGVDTTIGQGGVLSARHDGDENPITITAGGNIDNTVVELPKFAQINAGMDINNLTLHTQNLSPSNATTIIAGRDIVSSEQGKVISVGGPGRMDIIAGRNIDLGVSFGIESTGRLNDPNIKDAMGADISMLAGMSATWNVSNFIDKVVATSDAATENSAARLLIDYVESISGDHMALADAVSAFKLFSEELQRPFVLKSFFNELVHSGSEANAGSGKGYARGYAAIDALFPDSRGDNNPYQGDISMLFSRVYTLSGGNINMLVPGGKVDVGIAARPRNTTINKEPGQLGIVAEQAGDINIFTHDDVSVNSSRIFTLGGGNIAIWSTLGNIDAGKGAKSSLSVPPPSTTIDTDGNVTLVLTGAVAGSGIRTIQTNPDTKPGDVALIAPAGIVDAGDAGIGASGNIIVAAKQVVGAENINFGGQASGVPAATSGVGVALAGASQTGGSSDKSVDKSVDENARDKQQDKAPIAQAALSWLEVFVTGLGEENCKQDDVECLKRQK